MRRRYGGVLLFGLLFGSGLHATACRGGAASAPATGSAISDLDDLDLGTSRAIPVTGVDAAVAAVPAADAAPAIAETSPVASAEAAGEGRDFIDDAQLLYRVAACGGADRPLPEALTGRDAERTTRLTGIVGRHCTQILGNLGTFRALYFEKHRGWFARVVPDDAPATVVYPFGGGDLLSALVAFPDAREITTISLEQAGDPRRLRKLDPAAIERSLGALRVEIGGLISVGSNTSENLSNQQRNELPGQVSSFLLGLVAAGYEPVAMRYFTLTDAGELAYLDQAAIDAADRRAAKSLKHGWQSPSFSEAFQNVELQYRRPGEDTVRVHRHIGWNLANAYLAQHPQLLRHLEHKGKVTLLTKGASYLLWRPDFSKIRNYMLAHLAWMLSDSTGIPPALARKAGMVQVTYGRYHGAFLAGAQGDRSDAAFIELWQQQPRRALPFRFGYVDLDKQAHLVVTRPR